MEKYQIKVRSRIKQYIVLIIIISACIPALYYLQNNILNSNNLSEFIKGYQFGLLAGIEGVLFTCLIINIKSLKNIKFCEKQFIKENDERTKIIKLKSSTFCYSAIMLILGLATIISGFYSITVFFTLLSVLMLILLFTIISTFYFEKHN